MVKMLRNSRIKFTGIRGAFCKCNADSICEDCLATHHVEGFLGPRLQTTWNEAVAIHNKEVCRGTKTKSRR